mmetsp:Transcript_13573/g.39138  ORF Transcript_13573/g.39138 Transcript_13573/m.39138 type:complete len:147 (+) Transcript_13573:168-608(+)
MMAGKISFIAMTIVVLAGVAAADVTVVESGDDGRVCPPGCVSWFDGCNNCFCNEDGSLGGCTRKFCPPGTEEPPRCRKWAEPERLCPVGCLQWFDGCNWCQCSEDGTLGACTLRLCPPGTEEPPKCLRWATTTTPSPSPPAEEDIE